ncbi:V-SNARE coiled-coil homology domain-containing protein [Caenorhabditis elegans]|uniref:V-SNARE coiled-coil homology domain-containing protein n=1 Tax=Caenorhabditis elegans TaxID=6239 RepID=Q95XH1_CAEEL|nr:V-SNARE coiled-coil homology domain-containing protein [Caenorhabditis elegans]CCD74113.2 V-SNARE coiled-coil homology domain-containing protein [Caenorhabditis elegans]|eukprot:NP_500232.3 VAMP (Vesicle Associated Membrane Protein) homolog [Caenorhabditis elegans]
MPGRVMSVVLCRPTVSGDIVPIAMGNCENMDEATKFNDVKPPNDSDVIRLVKSRVRTYFNNDGVIELDGGYHLYFVVVIETFSNMVYCCVGEAGMGIEEALEFLNSKIRSIMDYSNIQMVIAQSNAYDLLGHLQPDILKFIVSFSVFFHLNLDFFLQKQHNETFPTAQQQRMIDIRRQVDDVRQVMADNVERIMERGERLENMENRTEALRTSATSFKSTARRVQRHFCQKNLKWTLILLLVVTIIVAAIVLTILHKNGVI